MITLQLDKPKTHSSTEDTETSAVNIKSSSRLKRTMLQKFRLRRISPCLIVEFALPMIFVYSVIKQIIFTNGPFLFCMMIFFEINFLLIDFALWNFYKDETKSKIWMIESGLIFITASIVFLLD